MKKNHFLLFKKLKYTESAQLCMGDYIYIRVVSTKAQRQKC